MISGSLPALGCVAAASVLTVFDALGYGGFLLGDDRRFSLATALPRTSWAAG
jgi:hypothetical protein